MASQQHWWNSRPPSHWLLVLISQQSKQPDVFLHSELHLQKYFLTLLESSRGQSGGGGNIRVFMFIGHGSTLKVGGHCQKRALPTTTCMKVYLMRTPHHPPPPPFKKMLQTVRFSNFVYFEKEVHVINNGSVK